jgi:hypothetical protein
MTPSKVDPQHASEIARQKSIVFDANARWGRMLVAQSIVSVVLGVGAWFLPEPTDRSFGVACAVGVSAWLIGLCLACLFDNSSTPKCPQCGLSWGQEGGTWPSWKHCPGCGLKMTDDPGDHRPPR